LTAASSGRGNHIVDFAAAAGTTYQIALDSLDAAAYNNFTFRLLPGERGKIQRAFLLQEVDQRADRDFFASHEAAQDATAARKTCGCGWFAASKIGE